MGRKCAVLLVVCLLVLTGCAGESEPAQNALLFRTKLMEAGGCAFTAGVTASYEDRIYQFELSCRADPTETKLQVLAPESIAGISAAISGSDAALSFDGTVLELGKMANGSVSPVACPWLLTRCWMNSYIAYSGKDGDLDRVTYLYGYDEDAVTVDTWFRDGVPVAAEVVWDGIRCLYAEIKEFQI